jgi:cephalosporin-C deacetylase-like acetyl esterase
MRYAFVAVVLAIASGTAPAQLPDVKPLVGTAPLELDESLDVVMARGINRFAEEEIALSPGRRERRWRRDFSSAEAHSASVEPNRKRLAEVIGVRDERVPFSDRQLVVESWIHSDLPNRGIGRYPLFEGVDAEFYLVDPRTLGSPAVILIPDADWAPEQMTGEIDGLPAQVQLARRLAEAGIATSTLRTICRSAEFSGRADIRFTNQPHREYLYRPAFELGRHIIGYEVQKILRAVDAVEPDKPVVVWGIGEGGLLALYAAAIDPRIDVCVVSGYFQEREDVWKEPIYRNVWRLLDEFGDANIAGLLAPRRLIIEACAAPEVDAPPAPSAGRAGAAPGAIVTPAFNSVEREFTRARAIYEKLGAREHIQLIKSGEDGRGLCGAPQTMEVVKASALREPVEKKEMTLSKLSQEEIEERVHGRQRLLVEELRRHTQRLLHASAKERDKFWSKADRTSLASWEATSEAYRTHVHDELIGRIPYALLPPNVRSRHVIDEPTHTGHEIVMDVFKSEAEGSQPIVAGGILLVPKDLKPGEKRPCVVCQHGLEGTAMDTIATDPKHPGYRAYKGFSTQLVQRGFIVYAPQNPYRGKGEFRVIQRKSNPLGRSLFSYIIPQHQQTLNWLAGLPYVDPDRIGFYGLSYGGKTAMRVPPLLPPRAARDGQPAQPGYCLSICSADFNEWILKNASTEDRYSYVFTNEYEIFEWNMGHIANYAELASLMTPRPFMVERGHDDGVAPDEWVAWEFAKVRRHYDKLGIGDRTEIEVFNGPHTINGKGTFDFLHRHLNWPQRSQ